MADCPRWSNPETPEQLPYVVAGLSEFYRFIVSACKQRYIIRHGDLKTYHRKVFERVVPLDYYAGNYRCEDVTKPCLATDVGVNGVPGTAYTLVPAAMTVFSTELQNWILRTDRYIAGSVSPTERAQAVAQLAAMAMARLINIHPFINGNGRSSRMLVNYIFKRYGYRMPFSQGQIRPPETEYGTASAAAMGPNCNPKPLYIYLLHLAARGTAAQ